MAGGIEQGPITLYDELVAWAVASPDALAIDDGVERLTTAEALVRCERIAAGLEAAGVTPGDRVFLRARGSIDLITTSAAVARVGAVACPVNPKLGAGELAALIAAVGPVLCVDPHETSDEHWTTLARVLDGAPATPRSAPRVAAPDELALLGFTGGTTGVPKAVMHSWRTTHYAVTRQIEVAGLEPGDALLGTLALGSAPGYAFSVHMALRLHGPLVVMERWDPAARLELAARTDCRWTIAVPSQVEMLADAAEPGLGPWHRMRAISVGGAPMRPPTVERWEDRLGAPILRMFGMSECLGHCSMRRHHPRELRVRFDGIPFEGTEDEAYGPDGVRLPRGEAGQAGVRGPSLFLGYFGQPELTAQRFAPDGAYLTGDRIVRHPDGFVEVVGREVDMIIRGGTNIDPAEIETMLASHASVRSVAVVGAPDRVYGETIAAFVVVSRGAAFDLDAARAHFEAQGIAPFKWPARVEVVEELPLTPMGKVDKSSLRTLLADVGEDPRG